MIKDITFTRTSGDDVGLKIKSLSFVERNDVFDEFLDLNRALKTQGQMENENVIDYLKEEASPLKFMEAILRKGVHGIRVEDMDSDEAQVLFETHSNFILTGKESDSLKT